MSFSSSLLIRLQCIYNFWCSMLVFTPFAQCFVTLRGTFMLFQNWPINKLPQCQFPVFCCFCISEKLYRKYSRNWTKQKPDIQIFHRASRELKRSWSGATRGPHTRPARPTPGPRRLGVRPPRSTSDDAHSPIMTPRWEKPKYPINFLETHRDPPPASTRDREGPEALPSTLPKRRIATGGLLHRHACLRSDEWGVYLGLWVHSSC
jgi:hypothetical protein